MPAGLSWMRFLNPYTYYLQATLSNQLHELVVTCLPSEYTIFNPPPGQTCQQYAGPFVSASPGYLGNPGATSACEFCPISTGDDYLELQLGWSYANIWTCVGVLVGMVVFNKLMTFVFVRWRGTGGNR